MIQTFGATILVLGFLFFGLPNMVNQRERSYFSSEERIARAKEFYKGKPIPDSVTMPISMFYDRGFITKAFFGKHNRHLWTEPVTFPVFKGFDSLAFAKTGGGMQTTSVEMNKGDEVRIYTFRSVDKDPSVLQGLWKYSAIRTLLRDQASAFNPYAAIVVSELSEAINIWHTTPMMCVIPYTDHLHDSVTQNLAGQVVLLEEEMDAEWKEDKRFNFPEAVSDTEDMIPLIDSDEYIFDKRLFIKNRLFDILISDWDRHEGQWKWLEFKDSLGITRVEPFPVDRDMAMGQFHDGLVNKVYVGLGHKFSSYRPSKRSMLKGAKKHQDLDVLLLKGIDKELYIQVAKEIQDELNRADLESIFRAYPAPIYSLVGEEHINTLKERLEYLPDAAEQLHRTINK